MGSRRRPAPRRPGGLNPCERRVGFEHQHHPERKRASTFPRDSLRPRSAGDLVVDVNLPDLRLWRANFLERLTEPPREEAVEVLTRVPDVDDHETGVGLAGRMEGLTLTELAPAFFELPHDVVVLLELAPGDVDQQTNGHCSSRSIA